MLRVMHQIDAPILVDDGPADYAGMIAVPVHDSRERVDLASSRSLRRESHVGKLGPDQQADTIGHFVIARIRNLDVAPKAIQAKLLRLAELTFEKFRGGQTADCLGVIVLIQSAPEVERFAIEEEPPLLRLDLAKAELVG